MNGGIWIMVRQTTRLVGIAVVVAAVLIAAYMKGQYDARVGEKPQR